MQVAAGTGTVGIVAVGAAGFALADGVVRGHSRRTSDGGRGVMGKGLYMYALLGMV